MSYAEDHGYDAYEYEDFVEDNVRMDEWIKNKQKRSLEKLLVNVEKELKPKKLKKIKKLKKKVKELIDYVQYIDKRLIDVERLTDSEVNP